MAPFNSQRVLVVAPEKPEGLIRCVERIGGQCAYAATAGEAKQLLSQQAFDVLFSASALPDSDALSLVQSLEEACPDRAVLLNDGRDSDLEAAAREVGFSHRLPLSHCSPDELIDVLHPSGPSVAAWAHPNAEVWP